MEILLALTCKTHLTVAAKLLGETDCLNTEGGVNAALMLMFIVWEANEVWLEHTKMVRGWVIENGCVHPSHIDNDGVWWGLKVIWDTIEQGVSIRMSQRRRNISVSLTNHIYRNTMRTCYRKQTRGSRNRGFILKWMNWKSCCRNWVSQIKLRVTWIRWMTLSIWLRGVLLS